MKNLGTTTIVTNRLILRRFSKEDAKAMFENWASDDNVSRYTSWPTHKEVKTTEHILSLWINSYGDASYYNWAIELKETNELIGNIAVVASSEEEETVEIGYCSSKKFWNHGYMSEALNALIEFFFNEVEMQKIILKHDKDNPASGKVMTKCGLKFDYESSSLNKNGKEVYYLNYYINKEMYIRQNEEL